MIRQRQGFTLLELLIAIAIFGMVIGLAYSSYNATFHIINSAESQTRTYSKARTALKRMMEDLESFYPGSDMVFQGTGNTIQGHRADILKFTSLAHVRLHPDTNYVGHIMIHYQVQEDTESGSLLLYRKELPAHSTDEGKDFPGLLLCDNLQEVAFDYLNADGQDVEQWEIQEDQTQDTTSLPRLITITLRFKDGKNDEAGTMFKTSLTLPVVRKNNND